VGLERGPLSLVSTIKELLERKRRGSGLEIREYGHRDPLRWPRDTLYPQNIGTNFADKQRTLGRYSSLVDKGHGMCLYIYIYIYILDLFSSFGISYKPLNYSMPSFYSYKSTHYNSYSSQKANRLTKHFTRLWINFNLEKQKKIKHVEEFDCVAI
jgi:hypothetical protein